MVGVKLRNILFGILLLVFFFIGKIAQLFTDFWWFDALGFKDLFLITLKSKIFLFLLASITFFIFAIINIWISTKIEQGKQNKNLINKKPTISFKAKAGITFLVSLFVGVASYPNWFKILEYLNQNSFNLLDPIFSKDISFYIFSLPFFTILWKFTFATVFLTLILVILDYFPSIIKNLFNQTTVNFTGKDKIPNYNVSSFSDSFSKLKRKALVHISLLISFIFVLLSVNYYLARFTIMYSSKGIVVGAGYADVVAYLPMIKILMVLALVVSVVFWFWIFYISKHPRLKKRHILSYVLVVYLLFAFIGPTLITGIVQGLIVAPNELNLEKPYINNNINFTKIAYGLDNVEENDYPANIGLTRENIENSKNTMDNIRILDWRPLTQTYKQTQEIRLYYELAEIDIDRYMIDGKLTQVMLSPRELDQNQITPNAKTWVNLHMVYSHGYGIVMSPVNQVTDQGLPNYLIQDIPPKVNIDEENLKVDNPMIYYGEKDNDYVLVNTKTAEFNYPKGDTNEYNHYDGKGGIVLDSFFKKVMMAIKFADIKILLSSDITTQSKIMFNRDIMDRVSKITPFLTFDSDPYITLVDGQLFWIIDAYTTSNNYPYSQKIGRINYIRNSVKIVIDAYNGNIDYYIASSEPIIDTYSNIFPGMFKTFDKMPEGLKSHTRYPVDLFKIQSEIYNTYHMNDASIFYNKEDAWQTPTEIYGTGQQVKVEPYYIIMNLPGEEKEEFILMSTFTPIGKNNMVAWLAARNDGDNYGKLLLYKFPKDKLIFGPLQIEAKFDQDSLISQQLTLWSQQGSRVTRGNLLVIPIKDSILYVEPLYLQAETGQLPELKRILVSDGERVVMERTLGEALEALFGKAIISKTDENNQTIILTDSELIDKANTLYANILDSMENQDWEGIGDNLNELGVVLENLKE